MAIKPQTLYKAGMAALNAAGAAKGAGDKSAAGEIVLHFEQWFGCPVF
jgi:hypothetical protein